MKGAVAIAAILVAPGCGGGQDRPAPADPLRRASYRSLAARDFLLGCPGAPARAETRREIERLAELNRFALEKGAQASLQLAANEWAGIAPHDTRARCAPGEAAYGAALADFSRSLDDLAVGIREYRR
ncbi:MAG TPA: hypothetical protein VGW40_07135 [Allosphingosinicella sp.]|nr:hypothetical protein [Allosphingosinicella sp.]